MDITQDFAPGMLSFTDQPEFDYSAFLQTDDINFGESAQSQLQVPSDSSGKATPPSSTSGSGGEVAVRSSAQKQRLERKGHTKSRRGCYNCKRRRIKCQETHPACGHCTKTGLKCEYPSTPQIIHQEDIWTHEIPCIAQNHEYLMHAILGFSASELMRNDASVISSAMNHRIKAIRAIKKRLAETTRTSMEYEEANAMVATCYALTFQSVSLEDGLTEYLTFIRGIMIVGMQMMFRGIKPIFENMMEQDQSALLEPLMQGLPLIPKGLTDSAMEALTKLELLCTEPVEVEYYQHLLNIVEKLYVNSWDAQYGWWMLLPHDTFQALIDPDNQVMMLLHAHWVAINEVMSPISKQERHVSEKYPRDREGKPDLDPGFARWLKHLNANVDLEHQRYNQWPMWVEQQLEDDMTFFGRTS
ncbi:hypothetical protein ACHAPA_007331 [Fusarium lateritium]